jgi:small conductance mechanosensitive channel
MDMAMDDATVSLQKAVSQVVVKLNTWIIDAIKMLPNLVVAIFVLAIFWFAAGLAGRLVNRLVSRFTPYDNIARLTAGFGRLMIVGVGVMLALSAMSLDRAVASMLAGVGIVSIAIGFASKDIAGDYMAGFLIHFTHPFRTGDIIKTGDFFGYVDAMGLRVTRCRTQQGQRVIIPNRKIVSEVSVNYTMSGMRRVDLPIAIDWAEDLPRVEELCVKAVESLEESLRDPGRQVEFFYEKFDGTNINFSLRFWTKPEQQTYLKATSEALKAVSQAFKENKVEMVSSTIALDFGMPGKHSLKKQLEGVSLRLPPPEGKPEEGEKSEEKEKGQEAEIKTDREKIKEKEKEEEKD